MSPNLDLVRSIYADWERGDFSSAEWADADIAFVIASGTEPGTYTGVPAMAHAWRVFLSAWEDLCTVADEFRELDPERVLVLHTWSGVGKSSALAVEQMTAKSATLFDVRGGKVTKLVAYWDRDRALADLGLAPEADPER
jgi:ketosteroid isomerase-like protein